MITTAQPLRLHQCRTSHRGALVQLVQNGRKPPFSFRSRCGSESQSREASKTAENCDWHGPCYVRASRAFKYPPFRRKWVGAACAYVRAWACARARADARPHASNSKTWLRRGPKGVGNVRHGKRSQHRVHAAWQGTFQAVP